MIDAILNGLLPVAFLVSLGWLAGRLEILKHADASIIATYVMSFALPFSLFDGAIASSPEQLLKFGLLGALTLGIVGTFLLGLATGRIAFGHDTRTSAIQALLCSFPDMAYFAAPVLAALFGAAGFLCILLGNLVVMIVILPATIILVQIGSATGKGGGGRLRIVLQSLAGAIRNPIVWLPVLGVGLSLLHLSLPHSVQLSAETIGKSAAGTSLFALGLMLYGEKVGVNANVLANIGIKNFVQPLMIGAFALLFGLPGPSVQQAILTGAAPSATAATMFALKKIGRAHV